MTVCCPRFVLAMMLFIPLLSCERPVEIDEPTEPVDLSITNILHEPRLVSPKDGRVYTNSTQVLLRWGWVAAAKSYSVQVAVDTLFSNLVFAIAVDTTLVRTPPLDGIRFFWRVKAHNDRLTSTWSELRSFSIRID